VSVCVCTLDGIRLRLIILRRRVVRSGGGGCAVTKGKRTKQLLCVCVYVYVGVLFK